MTKTGRDGTDTGSVKRYQKVLSKGIIKRYQNDLHTQTLYLQLMMSNDRPLCVCVYYFPCLYSLPIGRWTCRDSWTFESLKERFC